MVVTIDGINKRLYKLNYKNLQSKVNLSEVALFSESTNIFFENNAINAINNWEGLDENTNVAFNKALDIFDNLIMYGNESATRNACDFLTESINKVRDSKALANSIKYRISRIKTKINGNINNATDKVNDAIKSSVNNFSSSISKTSTALGSDKEAMAEKCYEQLIDQSKLIIECDRIVNNYNSVCKRFDLDKKIQSIKNETDGRQTIYEIASYIDTYNSPFKNKYNTALEAAWYGFNKYHIEYSNTAIIEGVTDYFIFNGGLDDNKLHDINYIRNASPIFENTEFDCINFLYDNDEVLDSTVDDFDVDFGENGVTYSAITTNLEEFAKMAAMKNQLQESYEMDNTSTELDVIKVDTEIKELINDFKKACSRNNDSIMNLSYLKALITNIFNKDPYQIIFNISSIFDIVRTVFIYGETNIDDILEVVDSITNELVKKSIIISRKQCERAIKSYEKEIEIVNSKLDNASDSSTKDRLNKYSKRLNSGLDKIKRYYDDTFSEDDQFEKYEFDEDSEEATLDNQNSEENDIEGSGLVEAATIVMISNLVESVSEGLIDTNVDGLVCGNVYKFDNDTIDAFTDFSVTVPVILEKEKLEESLINYRNTLRSKEHHTIQDYIRIDCLNDNIRKLQENNTVYNVTNNPKGVIAYLMCLEEIERSQVNSSIVNEQMSFTNTLKIALNNLKHSVTKLSDKEKRMSNSIDVAMNSIIKSMDKEMSASEREAVVRGSIIPPASKCIKIAITLAAAWVVNPAIAIIGALGAFVCKKRATVKERQLALDEIEVELKMCERYIRIYEDQNDMQKLRQCEMIQRNLERQRQRIKYKMKIDFRHADTSSVKPYSSY